MKEVPLEEIVKEKFGFHRGFSTEDDPPNSLAAIKRAVALEPFMVEFDVVLVGENVKTAHPPQEPMEALGDVLTVFRRRRTYPKVDIKVPGVSYVSIIKKTLAAVTEAGLDFALINIGVQGNPLVQMEAEQFLVREAVGDRGIGLNINLARYRPAGENHRAPFGEVADKHVETLGDICSISPEIKEEDWELAAGFAQRHGIGQIHFWLRGWPDVPDSTLSEGTVREALKLEDRYPVKVYFDIDPRCIKGFELADLR